MENFSVLVLGSLIFNEYKSYLINYVEENLRNALNTIPLDIISHLFLYLFKKYMYINF